MEMYLVRDSDVSVSDSPNSQPSSFLDLSNVLRSTLEIVKLLMRLVT
jgi:hypothetical protein